MAKHGRERDKYLKREHNQENGEKKGSKLRGFIFFIFLIVFLFSAINLIRWAIYNKKSSEAIDAIIEETLSAVSSERTSRVIDSDGGSASMEKRKREGYF